MKRNWKRILSLWLTICMVFTMNFGLGATAVYADVTANDYTVTLAAKEDITTATATALKDQFTLTVKKNNTDAEEGSDKDYEAAWKVYKSDDTEENDIKTTAVNAAGAGAGEYVAEVTLTKGSNADANAKFYDGEGAELNGGKISATLTVTKKAAAANPTIVATDTDTKVTVAVNEETGVVNVKNNNTSNKIDVKVIAGNEITTDDDITAKTGEDVKGSAEEVANNAEKNDITITPTTSKQTGYVYVRYSETEDTKASTWVSTPYTVLATEANVNGTTWDVKKENGDSLTNRDADITTDEGTGKTTVKLLKNISIKLVPGSEAGELAINMDGKDGDINVAGATVPKKVTIANYSSGSGKIKAADDALIVKDSDKTIINGDGVTIADGDYYVVNPTYADVNEANVAVLKDNLSSFKLAGDGAYKDYALINLAAGNLEADTSNSGYYKLTNTANPAIAYAFKNDGGLVSFNVAYNTTAKTKIDAIVTAKNTKLEGANRTVEINSISFNIAKGDLAVGPYTMEILKDGGDDVATKEFYVEENSDTKVIFSELPADTEYDTFKLSQNAVWDDDEKALNLGYTSGAVSFTNSLKTRAGAPTEDDINFSEVTPKHIMLSANKTNVRALLVSADSIDKANEIANAFYKNAVDNSDSKYFIALTNTAEGKTDLSSKVIKDKTVADASVTTVIPGTDYYVYAAFFDGTYKPKSDMALITEEPINKPIGHVKLEIKVNQGEVEYQGKGVSLSDNFTVVSTNDLGDYDAIYNTYKVRVIAEKDYNYGAEPSTQIDNGVLPDKENYSGNTLGYPIGKYIVLAQYKGDGEYYDDTVITVSENFNVVAKPIYLKPDLGISTVSAGSALTTTDYNSDNFKYVVIKDGKTVDSSDIKLNGSLGNKYVFTTETGEIINANTKFTEGNHRIYISANGATLNCGNGDDPKSYSIISEYNQTGALFATLTSIKLQTPTIEPTGEELYYHAYTQMQGMKQEELKAEIAKYVRVKMGSTNITEDSKIEFLYWDSVNKKLTPKNTLPKELSANDLIFVSANYADPNADEDVWITSNYVTLKIKEQHVGIVGTTAHGNARNASEQDKEYGLDDTVEIYTVSKNGELTKTMVWSGKLSEISQKAFSIDISGVNNSVAARYGDLPMTWDSTSINNAKRDDAITYFAKNYTIDSAHTYVKDYVITPVVNVRVLDATDGSVISTNAIDGVTKLYSYSTYPSTATSFYVSLNRAEPNAFKYSGYDGRDEVSPGGSNDELSVETTTSKYVYNLKLNNYWDRLVTLWDNGDSVGDADIDIYAYYKDSAANSSGNITVDAIAPVYYNGNKQVAYGTAFKKGQTNSFAVVVKAGDNELSRDVDYKLSYKNNVNAAYASDAKAPQVIIKGIGQYKGLKITAKFTILPRKFSSATAKVKSKYIPLTKKGVLKLGETLTLGGKKVGKGFYTLSYRDYDTNKVVTQSELAAAYEGTKALHLYVYATSVNPKGKKVNFSIGDTVALEDSDDDKIDIYAYPKGSKALKVKLANKGKVTYSASKLKLNVSDIIDGKNETITVGKLTVSKNMLDEKQLKFYSDKNFTKYVGDPAGNTGTYYLMVVPSADNMAKTGVYRPTAVKVQFAGEKITKKLISLATKKQVGTGVSQKWTLTTSLTTNDFKAYVLDSVGEERELTLNKTTNNKTTNGYWFNAGETYESGDNNTEVDQGYGSYTVVIEGIGKYSGKLKLKYGYSKGSLKSLGYTGIQVNGGKAVEYDPSEGKAASGTYQKMELVILSANKVATNFKGTKAEYKDLVKAAGEIKDIAITGSSVGKGKGKVTITFKNYSGKLTGTFDIEQVAVNDSDVRRASIYKNDKTARVYLARNIGGVDYAFKKGTDYKVGPVSVLNDTTGSVTIDITEKGRIKGSSLTATFPIYQGKVTDIKIVTLSENGKGNNDSAKVAYNTTGKFYEYQGTSAAVMPKVDKVTAKIDGVETVIPSSYYDVTYTPVTGKDKDGKTIFVKGTYKVTITLNNNSGNTYPSYSPATTTYKVSEALK